MKQIYLVWSCDQWCSKPMSLLMATTSKTKVKMFISKMIEAGEADYEGYNRTTNKSKAAQFRKDFEDYTRDALNGMLKYVFFDYVYDGEEV